MIDRVKLFGSQSSRGERFSNRGEGIGPIQSGKYVIFRNLEDSADERAVHAVWRERGNHRNVVVFIGCNYDDEAAGLKYPRELAEYLRWILQVFHHAPG